MKISELIKELQLHQDEFGDLETYCTNEYGLISSTCMAYYADIRKDERNPLQVGIVIES